MWHLDAAMLPLPLLLFCFLLFLLFPLNPSELLAWLSCAEQLPILKLESAIRPQFDEDRVKSWSA